VLTLGPVSRHLVHVHAWTPHASGVHTFITCTVSTTMRATNCTLPLISSADLRCSLYIHMHGVVHPRAGFCMEVMACSRRQVMMKRQQLMGSGYTALWLQRYSLRPLPWISFWMSQEDTLLCRHRSLSSGMLRYGCSTLTWPVPLHQTLRSSNLGKCCASKHCCITCAMYCGGRLVCLLPFLVNNAPLYR
jgi:hypothetical protein